MKRLLPLFFALLLPIFGHAGTFSYNCQTKVDCKGLFNDLISDKFTEKYNSSKWEIFIYADTFAFGNGSGATYAVAGVIPLKTKDKFSSFPNVTQSAIKTTDAMGNAYQKYEIERQIIRKAIEGLMAECENRPACNLD